MSVLQQESLPQLVLLKILSELPPEDLVFNVRKASPVFRCLIENHIWKNQAILERRRRKFWPQLKGLRESLIKAKTENVSEILDSPEVNINQALHNELYLRASCEVPLIEAVKSGRPAVVKLFLSRPDLKVNQRTCGSDSAFRRAIECCRAGNDEDSLAILKLLLQVPKLAVNRQDHEGNTELHRVLHFIEPSYSAYSFEIMIHSHLDLAFLMMSVKSIDVTVTNRRGLAPRDILDRIMSEYSYEETFNRYEELEKLLIAKEAEILGA